MDPRYSGVHHPRHDGALVNGNSTRALRRLSLGLAIWQVPFTGLLAARKRGMLQPRIYELSEDVEDIALPLTAEQYKHNVENVHMCLG